MVQVSLLMSQLGVGAEQSALDVHCTHTRNVVLQTGVAARPAQSASMVQPHLSDPAMQTGFVPVHGVVSLAVHCTQVLFAVLQAVVLPVHAVVLVAVHVTQTPVVVLQAGVDPEHCWSMVHPAQVWVAMLQFGVEPEHCVFDTHWTQEEAVPSTPSQTPAMPVHAVPDAATPQVPVAHELQVPLQAMLQQTPATQLPLEHWAPSLAVQLEPFAWAGAQ
jgi:hypothetical protein